MALVLADRVLETTTTAGSGTITLAGAEPGYQSFSAVGDGNQTYYTITADTAWEVGIGTYTASGTTLSRDTVLSSSASGAKVTFPAGVKKVFVTYPSEKSVNLDVSGNISLSSAVISGVGYPSADSDAATKLYVDTLAAEGISYHEPVKYEVPNTTGNLNATYNNGTAGVSATLTNAGTLAAFVPDGVTASISDRVLVYNQTNAAQNGVYTVTVVGNGSTAWVLTRATDADTYGVKTPNALGAGDAFYVTSGNTGAGETYVCNTPGVISFGSTAITFAQISSAQVYQAGNGISLTNTVISLATPVAVGNGGTGISSTPTNGQLLIGNGSNYTLSTLTAGSGVSITNSAGSITLSATGLGGTVTAVTATGPLASSGGTAPNISIANSTGTGSVVLENSPSIFSATITAALSASITTITGSSANITTVTGTTAGFSSANITHAGITSATVTTLSGTNVTYSSGTVSQLAATSATIATVSGTNATYSNGNFTSATVTTVSGTTATYTSATVTNLNVTSVTLSNLSIASANITTLTGTNLTYTSGTITTLKSTSATIDNLKSTSADITTLTGTTFGTTATTQLRGASGSITTLSGTTVTYSSGTITNLAATSITVTNTPAFVGNGTLTMNVSGTGLSGSQTFTANQSGNATFTVTSNATSANTLGAIVARDTSTGGFTCGDINAQRPASPTTGVIFLGNTGTRYVFFDGTNYVMPNGQLDVNGQRVLNAGNYSSYALPLSGGTMTGQITTRVTSGTTPIVNAAGSNSLQVMGDASNGAWFSFHRSGAYAINMGLDTSNVLTCGGWSDGANYRWQVDASGNFTARGNVTAYSDERVKKNWRPVQENLIEKISAVKSGVYDRTDSELTQVGVSAQSLREVLPEAVLESNGGELSVAYGNAALVAVIELAKEVIKLKAEVEALKRK